VVAAPDYGVVTKLPHHVHVDTPRRPTASPAPRDIRRPLPDTAGARRG